MTWVRLDDKFHSHPKILRVGNEGAGVYSRALSYCGDLLTDGFVPYEWVKSMAPSRVARSLVDVGLWEEVEGGYVIPDYLELNSSREEVKAKRSDVSQKRSEAGKKGAVARWTGKQTDGKPMAKGKAKGRQDDSHLHLHLNTPDRTFVAREQR